MSYLSQNHPLWLYQQDVNEICKSLFEFAGLSYFHFRRTYKDGSYVILSTNSNWPLYFINNKIAVKTPAAEHLLSKKSYSCLWEGNIPDKILSDAKNGYGITSAIAYIEKEENYFDSYSFGSARGGPTVATYLDNAEVFSKFSRYFHEKAFKLITQADKHRILVPTELKDLNLDKLISDDEFFKGKSCFLKKIATKEIMILTTRGPVMVTKRESECIEQLARGKTQKEIGILLGLSPRTVETHLEKAKNKLNCYMNSELINLWWANF